MSAEGNPDARQSSDEWCARASHRLLTLLTAISANLSILRRPGVLKTPKDYEEAIAGAEAAAELLGRAITSLFALEEIRPGRAACIPPDEIGDVVGIRTANVRLRYPCPDLSIETRIETGGHDFPLSRRELATILENLLDNALKFCDKPRPEIRLTVSCSPSSAVINIEDNGPGIAPDDQSRVFERFFQCENAAQPRGVGLGLTLVREIATARGGRVFLQSTPGIGTTVRLEIPLPAPEPQRNPESPCPFAR